MPGEDEAPKERKLWPLWWVAAAIVIYLLLRGLWYLFGAD
jgi:hypothetical protein